MPLIAHQTTHKVEERISELNDRLREIFQSIETEIQREKIMGGGRGRKEQLIVCWTSINLTRVIEIPKENSMKQKFLKK